jgi:diguanylate cyclase (GGDEF)-like protein/PAS domain S-box-containing protein
VSFGRRLPIRFSLQHRVMLTAGLAVAAILLADAASRQLSMQREGRHGLEERAAELVSIQSRALSVPVWNLDDDQERAVLDALAADPDFASAAVETPGGGTMQTAHTNALPAAGGTVDVARSINYVSRGQVRTLGTLRLSLSTARLQAALAANMRDSAVALLLLLSAVLLSLYGALRQLTRPLNMMTAALTRLAAGDRDTPIPARDHDDEVGALARALQVFRDTAFRLVKAENSYRALFDNAVLGIYGADETGLVHSVNAALVRICRYEDAATLMAVLNTPGRPGFYVVPERDAALCAATCAQDGFAGQISEISCGDGTTIWISHSARPVRDESGRILGYAGSVEDVTDRLRRQGEERLRVRAAMESATDAILVVDEAGTTLFANPAFLRCFGQALDNKTATSGLPSKLMDEGTAAGLAAALSRGQAWQAESEVLTIAGPVVPMLIRASPIVDESGANFGAVVICTDLTDRRRAEARIRHMAHHDWLTGLPNRMLFRDRLNAAALESVNEGPAFAVLCVDLDRFKAVNDTLGHAAGDRLLQLVAARLQVLVRHGDTVARVGGDEFILIQFGVRQADQAVTLAERVIHDLGQPYDLGGREVQIGASVGIALAPLHGTDPDALLGFADIALYEAKSLGRCRVSLFSREMDHTRRSRAELERDLRQAVAEDRLHLLFQPQYELATGRLAGAEALLRWTDPNRGAVSPEDFIPIAEESGLIDTLGEWVLATACRDALRWPDHLRVAVNVSPAQFYAGNLITVVQRVLAETGLAPDRLELEITEGVFMQDSDLMRAALMGLKALGVRITLDDFGTGYSSLSYLRRMPLDKIKVDRSFVSALGQDPAAHALVRSIIGLAKVLGLETNAEGVETKAQIQMLRDEGCQEVQGYYFGRPMPAHELAALSTGRAAVLTLVRSA